MDKRKKMDKNKGDFIVIETENYYHTKEIMRVPFQDLNVDENTTAGQLITSFKAQSEVVADLVDKNAKLEEKCALYQQHLIKVYDILEVILAQNSIMNIDVSNIKNILNTNNQEEEE